MVAEGGRSVACLAFVAGLEMKASRRREAILSDGQVAFMESGKSLRWSSTCQQQAYRSLSGYVCVGRGGFWLGKSRTEEHTQDCRLQRHPRPSWDPRLAHSLSILAFASHPGRQHHHCWDTRFSHGSAAQGASGRARWGRRTWPHRPGGQSIDRCASRVAWGSASILHRLCKDRGLGQAAREAKAWAGWGPCWWWARPRADRRVRTLKLLELGDCEWRDRGWPLRPTRSDQTLTQARSVW